MLFKSTRSSVSRVSFHKAVLHCIPGDGGLYVPATPVDLRQFFLHMDESTDYAELAAAVALPLLEEELNPVSAQRVAESAFSFSPTIKTLTERLSVLDLTTGPTGIFKDFGIAFLAALMEEMLSDGSRAVTLTATTGDTGVSVAQAFARRAGIVSVILYPDGPIRGLDPMDFIDNGGNILPLCVHGNFDDCQRLIREAFTDVNFAERFGLTSANTLNIGRLLPQCFYFFYAFIHLKKLLKGDLCFAIPSGNFGNLQAALYAWLFGLPVNHLIAAMNANDIFGQFLRGRSFQPHPPIRTVSTAMDVGNPTNYERMVSFYADAPSVIRNMVIPESVDDKATLSAMEEAWTRHSLLLDPHSAVGYAAAKRMLASDTEEGHIVVVATGHPAKHAELVKQATGQKAIFGKNLSASLIENRPFTKIEAKLDALKAAITGTLQ